MARWVCLTCTNFVCMCSMLLWRKTCLYFLQTVIDYTQPQQQLSCSMYVDVVLVCYLLQGLVECLAEYCLTEFLLSWALLWCVWKALVLAVHFLLWVRFLTFWHISDHFGLFLGFMFWWVSCLYQEDEIFCLRTNTEMLIFSSRRLKSNIVDQLLTGIQQNEIHVFGPDVYRQNNC